MTKRQNKWFFEPKIADDFNAAAREKNYMPNRLMASICLAFTEGRLAVRKKGKPSEYTEL